MITWVQLTSALVGALVVFRLVLHWVNLHHWKHQKREHAELTKKRVQKAQDGQVVKIKVTYTHSPRPSFWGAWTN